MWNQRHGHIRGQEGAEDFLDTLEVTAAGIKGGSGVRSWSELLFGAISGFEPSMVGRALGNGRERLLETLEGGAFNVAWSGDINQQRSPKLRLDHSSASQSSFLWQRR